MEGTGREREEPAVTVREIREPWKILLMMVVITTTQFIKTLQATRVGKILLYYFANSILVP